MPCPANIPEVVILDKDTQERLTLGTASLIIEFMNRLKTKFNNLSGVDARWWVRHSVSEREHYIKLIEEIDECSKNLVHNMWELCCGVDDESNSNTLQ